jgi:hypothetical protein
MSALRPVYEVDSFIAAGSFGNVFSGRRTDTGAGAGADAAGPAGAAALVAAKRAPRCDETVIVKHALLVREDRVKTMRDHQLVVDLASGEAWAQGAAFRPRELEMSRLLGRGFDARLLVARERAHLSGAGAADPGGVMGVGGIDDTVPLVPTLFDSFLCRETSLVLARSRDGEGRLRPLGAREHQARILRG